MKRSQASPLIGITVGTSIHWRSNGVYYRAYAAPIEAAGGECRRLGARDAAQFHQCDGLLVPGGWDIHPSHYDPLPGDERLSLEEMIDRYRVRCEPKRDDYELTYLRQALDRGVPVLGICRGIQALNVVLGRKLVPHIPACVPDGLAHKSTGPAVSFSHEISIEPGSLIERVYGGRSVIVNTRHHQGMLPGMVAPVLRVTALAPDGVVEAVEGRDSRFVVGVQWHPERKKDDFIHSISGPLFEAFVSACRDCSGQNR